MKIGTKMKMVVVMKEVVIAGGGVKVESNEAVEKVMVVERGVGVKAKVVVEKVKEKVREKDVEKIDEDN